MSRTINRPKSASCNCCHTPASFQSRSRRQHVMPEPQPSSWGRSSHRSSVRSTKRMPAKHCRSGMRGRPPRGFGGSCGLSGSMICHSSSATLEVPYAPPMQKSGFVSGSKHSGAGHRSFTRAMRPHEDQHVLGFERSPAADAWWAFALSGDLKSAADRFARALEADPNDTRTLKYIRPLPR
jgi:hypothetical protein